jgi:hypothetical protein
MSTDLYALVYVSTATHRLSACELLELQIRAQTHNRQVGVSGTLLYDDGNFIQYIEGPQAALLGVYVRIKRSHLHNSIIELLHCPIKERAFAAWSMAVRSVHGTALVQAAIQGDELAQQLMKKNNANASALMLLANFWCRCGQYRPQQHTFF